MAIVVLMVVCAFAGFTTGNNFFFIVHISANQKSGVRIMQMVDLKTEE